MADYLELYARHFELPVRSGVRVDRLTRAGSMYLIDAGPHRLEADNVVVAMSSYQARRIPAFAKALDPAILQMHSIDYRDPAQLKPGGVLLVGAGNSGAEIAMEVARERPTWLSGRIPDTFRSALTAPRRACSDALSFPRRFSSRADRQDADGPQRAPKDVHAGRAADPGEAESISPRPGVQRLARIAGRDRRPAGARGRSPPRHR
jgi:putative flavoprotein involved in K+ transport